MPSADQNKKTGTRIAIVFVLGFVGLIVGVAYTFGQTAAEYTHLSMVSIQERKAKLLQERYDLCANRMQRDEKNFDDLDQGFNAIDMTPEEIEDLRMEHADLEHQKELANKETLALQEDLMHLQEHSWGDEQNDFFPDFFDVFGGDDYDYDTTNNWYGDYYHHYDPNFWSWGHDEKEELEQLRNDNITLTKLLADLKKEKKELFLGVNKDNFKRDKEMMDCGKKLEAKRIEAMFSKKRVDKSQMTEGELQLYELTQENEKLKSALTGSDMQEKEQQIIKLKKLLDPKLSSDAAERRAEITQQIKELQAQGGKQYELLSLYKEQNNLLTKDKEAGEKRKDEIIAQLKAEIERQGK